MSVAGTEPEVKEAAARRRTRTPMTMPTRRWCPCRDKAAEKVKEIRGEENIEDGYALRLKVQGGGCSGFSYDLYFDQPQEIDRPFEVKGVKLICRRDEPHVPPRYRGRLRRGSAGRRVQVQQPEREVDLRLRLLVQRLAPA